MLQIAAMPLSKPLRMEHGQPMLHQHHAATGGTGNTSHHTHHGGDEEHGKPPSATLISQYAAKPYYSSDASQHTFTTGGVTANTTHHTGTGGVAASSSSAYERTPLVFLQEDYLVTSTSQHLQIWDGFPTGPSTLCDSKKIKNSYSCIKWCSNLQKLFCGDVLGGIDVWRIQLLPPSSSPSVSAGTGGVVSSGNTSGTPNKPTLIKERELTGHTDIITGLESISSMGFLLSCSMDASVRMYDLQGGVSHISTITLHIYDSPTSMRSFNVTHVVFVFCFFFV
jgi:WD40 repeat protein